MRKIILFSLIGTLLATGIEAKENANIDNETLEFLRVDSSKPEPELMFPPVAPVSTPKTKPEIKKLAPKKINVIKKEEVAKPEPISAPEEVIVPEAVKIPEEVKAPKAAVQPVEEVKVSETALEPVVTTPKEPESLLVIPKVEASSDDKPIKQDVKPIVKVFETKPVSEAPTEETKPLEKVDTNVVTEPEAEQKDENLEASSQLEPTNEKSPLVNDIEPLIPVRDVAGADSSVIIFESDSYSLSEEDKINISNTINNFENAATNKILIQAYNFDNGESSFKKKRLCLNRATEIRSYLIGLGYKNFSIKIVNTDDIAMNNKAEVSEIK